eukprot:COSAG06_NODE_11864_length_1454_cov_84.732775_3_plen_126_part_00
MQPPRHALGALLLEQGQIEEAAAVFSADLAAHPGGNVWALHGLTECEERVSENELLSTFCVKESLYQDRLRTSIRELKNRTPFLCEKGATITLPGFPVESEANASLSLSARCEAENRKPGAFFFV